jgi:hypothetical protein
MRIIRRVFMSRVNRQKMVTVPKDSDIEEGDYVEIKKV